MLRHSTFNIYISVFSARNICLRLGNVELLSLKHMCHWSQIHFSFANKYIDI